MSKRFFRFWNGLLLFAFVSSVVTPRPAKANPMVLALPAVVSGKAFVTTLGSAGVLVLSAPVLAGAAVFAIGGATYYYLKSRSETAVVSGTGLGSGAQVLPMPISIPRVKPVQDLVQERERTAAKAKPAQSAKPKESEPAEASEEATSSETSGAADHFTPPKIDPPSNDFDFNRFISAATVVALVESQRLHFQYNKQTRYSKYSNWGMFDPDTIEKWKTNEGGRSEEDYRKLREQLDKFFTEAPGEMIEKFKEWIESQTGYPRGFDPDMVSADLAAILSDGANFQFHDMIDKIGQLRDLIRDLESNPRYKELAEYWKKVLQEQYVNESGLLKDLPISQNPSVRLNAATAEGQRAATGINHVQLVMKKLEAAWVHRFVQGDLSDTSKETLEKIKRIAKGMDYVKSLGDKLTESWIRYGNGGANVDPSDLEKMVKQMVEFGESLERGELNLEYDLTKWVKENAKRAFESITGEPAPNGEQKDALEQADQYINWRKLTETIRRGEKVSGSNWSFDGWIASLDAPKKESSKDEQQKSKDEGDKNQKQREVVSDAKKEFAGRIIKDVSGKRFLVLDIKTSNDANREILDKNSDYEPSHKDDSIVAKVKSLDDLVLVKGTSGKDFVLAVESFFAPLDLVLKPDGTFITGRSWREMFSMPTIPNKAFTVKFKAGSEFYISLTSKVFDGIGNVLQFITGVIDPTAVTVESETPLKGEE